METNNPIPMWGIWNTVSKEFQFGICEPSKTKARKALFNKIGKDSYRWRFIVRGLPNGILPTKKEQAAAKQKLKDKRTGGM